MSQTFPAPAFRPKGPQTRAARKAAPALGRAVDALLRPMAKRHHAPNTILARRWAEIVGAATATLAPRAKISRGVLTVETTGAAAMALQHRAPEILERVNMHLGAGAATRIRFLQTG